MINYDFGIYDRPTTCWEVRKKAKLATKLIDHWCKASKLKYVHYNITGYYFNCGELFLELSTYSNHERYSSDMESISMIDSIENNPLTDEEIKYLKEIINHDAHSCYPTYSTCDK